MSSIIPDRLLRLLSYVRLRSDSAGTAEQQARPLSGSQHPSLTSDGGRQQHPVYENDGNVSSLPKGRTLQGQGKNHSRRKCFKNAVCVTLIFMWTVTLMALIIIRAAASLLIPDRCRKKRDIGNDVVLVSNAGRGLGRRLAIVFGLKAALVVCWDPDKERHMNTVYAIRHRGGRAVGFTVDVTDETAVTNAAEEMKREVGSPGILVMSAGRRLERPLLHWAPEDLEDMYRANVTPHLILLRTFLPEMLARNDGHLVCIISASASIPCCYDAPYAATKVGLAALMRGLADELEMLPGNKIRLTCVYPYHTERRPPLTNMAQIVVNQVLQGRRSVVVPKCSVFWLNVLRILPAPARRRWGCFMSRLSHVNGSKTSFEKTWPWGPSCPRHYSMQTPHIEGFVKYAPYEMTSYTSFDNIPLVLKKRKKSSYVEDKDGEV